MSHAGCVLAARKLSLELDSIWTPMMAVVANVSRKQSRRNGNHRNDVDKAGFKAILDEIIKTGNEFPAGFDAVVL